METDMKRILLAAAMAMCILSIGAFTASAVDLCGKAPGGEAIRHYMQEAAPILDALQAKNIELSDANTFGISETLATRTPNIARIDALENDIKALEDKIGAAVTKYGIAPCCLI